MKVLACLALVNALACPTLKQEDSRGVARDAAASAAEPQDVEAEIARAEQEVAKRSYARALEIYQRVNGSSLTDERRHWVEFRLADLRWRSAAQSNDPDASALDQAAHELRRQLERYERPESRDDLYAEIHESLGDGTWRAQSQDWGGANSHYTAALDWWAHSSDLEKARQHYLGIVWKAALPEWREQTYGYGYFPAYLALDVLANAVEIARTLEEKTRAHFLLGQAWINQGWDARAAEHVEKELGAVLASGKESEWYDDALFTLARFLEERGRWQTEADGSRAAKPDYARALELYRRLTGEFKKGETRYHDDCAQRIKNITAPTLGVQIERFFLPGSEVEYGLAWRNLAQIELALYPVDLTSEVAFAREGDDDWLSALELAKKTPNARWMHATQDPGRHEPGQARLTLATKPEAGAYVLLASSGATTARALLLVSDATVTVKVSGSKLLAWTTDARTGIPLADTELRLTERWHDGSWHRSASSARTGKDGIALFELSNKRQGGSYFIAGKSGARQSYAQSWIPGTNDPAREWRFYVTTDRGAYRPTDTVHWKLWARTRFASAYTTPANEKVTWVIHDPQGATASEGTSSLNAFGAAWGELATTAAMTLGEYRVQFYREPSKNQYLGEAALFRLEEYKLPEYEVAVKTPRDEAGRAKLFRLGDRVEVEIESTYYYGAPVAGAAVEIFVHQRPRYRPVPIPREFPWFYDDARETSWWGGPGQQILHEQRQTDSAGKAVIAFETPWNQPGEFEFTIEARVVDASRREIVGRGSVVVADVGYRVDFQLGHAVHRPGAKVEVELRATDPNDNPVEDDGVVTVTRQRYLEVWRDASGREVLGEALERAQAGRDFPPPGWVPKFQGYENDPIARFDLRTNAEGRARFDFTPDKAGHYRIVWASQDPWAVDVHAETGVFVADERTTQLGYLPGGVELIVDQDTLEVGKDASVLVVTPQSGRSVLFTVEGDELYHHEVLNLSGQAKLVRVPITALHVPNVFIGATAVWSGQAWQDVIELIVPPADQFLSVTVASDAADYEPGSSGRLAVTVKDRSGAPVAATLSLAVVDEAVAYIQGDYAIDPRRFFYGDKRPLLVQTGGTFQHGSFVDLSRDAEGRLNELRFGRVDKDDRLRDEDGFALGGTSLAVGRKVVPQRAMAAPAAEAMAADLVTSDERAGAGGQYRGPGDSVPPGERVVRVRSDFRSTALWLPDVTSDASGHASASVTFPDSTTRWKATVRACDVGARVGEGTTSARTRLPLIARLQTPRFLVVGDEVTLSANLNNNLEVPLTVQPTLALTGLEIVGLVVDGKLVKGEAGPVSVPANGQARVDWRVVARASGNAKLKLTAQSGEYGDSVERELPVHPHGIEAFVDLAGKLASETAALALALELPAARAGGSTRLTLSVAPSLAVTMLDALPYLVDYPYGCTEQTLSRFLPAVIVAKTCKDFGLSQEQALERVFGGIEAESAQKTHPKGKEAFAKLAEITSAGLERLYDFQHGDGGWAWWKDGDSNPFMTAYVLWGLSLARDAGLDVRGPVLANAARYLAAELVEAETELDLQAWELHALAAFGGPATEPDARKFQSKAFDNLWQKRDGLNAYGRALFALAAKAMGRADDARTLAENLANGAIRDTAPDRSILQVGTNQPYTLPTAHWGADGVFHRWSEGGVEATAFVLRALVAIDPKHELVPAVMNWLVKNRRGAQWSNTRDTAITVLALNDYLKASGELASNVEFALEVNGRALISTRIAKEQLLSAPSAFEVDPAWLRDGANEVRITRRDGRGPLYFAARARFFSQEEPIPPRGNELFVRRDAYRLAARRTLLAGTVYERVPLSDGDALLSGERVEVVLSIEAKNELEYLVFEDLKAAGLEAVQIRSGEPIAAQELKRSEGEARFGTAEDSRLKVQRRGGVARDVAIETQVGTGYTGRARTAHQELRDRQVAFFFEKLPQGLWELRYELRAEAPGRFHGLPTLAHAMYVPEIHANGSELRLEIKDR